jgi:hypothetical protein
MTNLSGSALRRRLLLYFVLCMGLTAPVWLGPLLESRSTPDAVPAGATVSSSPLAGCAEATAALAWLPRTLPGGPAARGPGGADQLARTCEVFRARTTELLEAPSHNADASRVRTVEILRIGFARALRSATNGTRSGQTTALPPPLSA